MTFEPADIDIDAVLFAQLATEGSAPDEVAVLYRGDLLEGVDGVFPEFESWLGPEWERLANIAVRLLEQLAAPNIEKHCAEAAVHGLV